MVDKYAILSEQIDNTINYIRDTTTNSSVELVESVKMNKILANTSKIFLKSKTLEKMEQQLAELVEDIGVLKDEIQRLSDIRDELEGRKNDKTVYTFPNYPVTPNYPIYPGEWKQQNNCPVCGLDWSGPMGYCCNNKDCPTVRATCTTL